MRIAYLCADPGIPVFGTKGASVHVQEVLGVLLAAGHTVDLVCRRTGGEPWPAAAAARAEGRLTVHELGGISGEDLATRELRSMAADVDVAALLETLGGPAGFDVVYERYSLWSRAGTAYARRHAIASVLEVNAPLPQEAARHRGLVHSEQALTTAREAIGAATAVVCVSQPVADWVHGVLEDPAHPLSGGPPRVVVEANGVDVERIRPARTAEPGTAAGPFTVGFVGTLKPWHGTETLLEAHALLRRSVPEARLLLVGDGPQAEALREQARVLGTAGSVEMTGAIPPRDVPALLHRMDVATAPYPDDGEGYFSPLKVLEYMAAGLPVVASAVGQLPGVLTHSETGFLVPGSDPVALAAMLHVLADDRWLRHRVGQAARAHVVRGHTWHHVVTRSLAAAGLSVADGAQNSALALDSALADKGALALDSALADRGASTVGVLTGAWEVSG